MSARGRLLSGLVTVVIALAGFVTVGALPAAASPRIVQYVALGDSYAAGQGGGGYLNDCLQTAESYPESLDSEELIYLEANPSCTGAKTFDVAKQVMQVTALDRDTRLVTLTVGAANLDLSGVATACLTGTLDECLRKIALARGALEGLGDDLTALYALVADAAPKARIVVTGYPHLFEPTVPVDPRITAINEATDALNATIRQAVTVTQDADVNIHYVDVTEEFAGHGIGAPPQLLFINPAGQDAFHPDADGYDAYAKAISAALPNAWVDKQERLA